MRCVSSDSSRSTHVEHGGRVLGRFPNHCALLLAEHVAIRRLRSRRHMLMSGVRAHASVLKLRLRITEPCKRSTAASLRRLWLLLHRWRCCGSSWAVQQQRESSQGRDERDRRARAEAKGGDFVHIHARERKGWQWRAGRVKSMAVGRRQSEVGSLTSAYRIILQGTDNRLPTSDFRLPTSECGKSLEITTSLQYV